VKEPSYALVELTVYDSLSLWYRSGGTERNPLRNRHFSESQMGAAGFRGRVSQVRILPGPLFFLSLLGLTRSDSFRAGNEAQSCIRTANLRGTSYDWNNVTPGGGHNGALVRAQCTIKDSMKSSRLVRRDNASSTIRCPGKGLNKTHATLS
jgi:hypothetical protein